MACEFSCALHGADKSGVGPNTISLPKGPGAIEGLGESFQPSLNTGTAKYGVGLKVPPGTAGHAPGLGLSYEGGSGNGPLGFGWSLPMSFIQRRTDKGIPTYDENVGFGREDVFINEMREELVPLANGDFFSKNEGAFIRYRQVGQHWEGVAPNGTVMEYGLTAQARVDDGGTNRVFSWLLQRQTDTRGNTIVYSYTSFPGPHNTNQKYLSAITYGPGAPPWNNFHFVTFNYEDRPDWFEDCRSGFVVRTGKRLKEIVIGTQGPVLANHLAGDFNGDGQTDYLNRKYVLDYLNYAGTNSHWSLLSQVLLVGADGTTSIPPSTFGYVVSNPPETLSASGKIIGGANEPLIVMDNPQAEFLDLNGDGLPDILKTDPGGGTHTAYLNRGEIAAGGGGRQIHWQAGVQLDSADGQAGQFNLQSVAPIAHLADMDGDGLADLTVTALDGSVLYFANRGDVGWGPRRTMSVEDSPPPSPFGNSTVRTADMDFDKRIDIIQSISTGNGADYRIWYNLGNHKYSPSVTVPQSDGFRFSGSGVHIADFNGDRLPDIARVQPAIVTVTAALGYGRFAEPVTVPIPDVVLDDIQAAKASLMDINGDGLSDLVIERAAPGQLWYWLNLGNYKFSSRKIITDMPTGVGGNAVIRWADLNGNGTTDLIYADSSSDPRMQSVDIGQLLNNAATPNVLVTISNGIGRVTTIEYESSTVFALADAAAGAPWPDLMPNPVQVVASVTTSDSLGHHYVTRFRYHNGYYDAAEKQFRGFAHAEQVEVGDPTAPTLVTRSHFDTGRTYEPMKGRLLAVSVETEDGGVFSTETNLWTTPPVTLYTGTNGTNVLYVHPTGKVSVISERGRGTPRRLESDFAYDRFGNQTTNADYGIVEDGDRTAFDDERITTTEYALNTDAWILRLLARQEIKDENGVVISRSESFYDDETFSGNNFGAVTIGNLTLTRAWINPDNAQSYVKASRTKYDVYGNPVALFDPLSDGSDNPSQGHFRQIAWDDRFHAYAISETIHVGGGKPALVFAATYNPGLATLLSSADANKNVTTYGYDALARLTSLVKPYDTVAFPTVEFDYALAVPVDLPQGQLGWVNYIETRQLDRVAGSAEGPRDHYMISRQFVDGLGRVLMTRSEAEPAFGLQTPRVAVFGAVLFNSRQLPSHALNAFFTLHTGALDEQLAYEHIEAPGWAGQFHEEGSLVTLNLNGAHRSSTEYDATLRTARTTNPDGSAGRMEYEPLVTRNFDENDSDPASPHFGTPMVNFSDGLGRLIRVDEVVQLNDDGTPADSPRTWTTRYQYDLNDQLTRITDSQNNVKELRYDGLQRKTWMNDPDSGLSANVYDDASNLAETIDAKGQRTTYTYDGVNRLLTEDYHDEDSPEFSYHRNPDVTYHYDTSPGLVDQGDGTRASAHNTKGMLAWVEDPSGEEHASFDARGRVEWTVKRIPDPVLDPLWPSGAQAEEGWVLVSYKTAFDHDSLDRVTRMVYPDNDEVGYHYNERSLVKEIVGGPSGSILKDLAYLPSAQQQMINHGNGVRTTYDYDSRLRLSRLDTRHAAGGTPLVQFAYDLDPVSNIRAIHDQRPGSVVPAGDPRRNTQLYQYDDLYRLTQVRYNPADLDTQPAPNTINYRYDRIGNMLAQTSDITHHERGVSVTDLGDMSYGGAAGAANRLGREPNAPPGPHALSTIRHASLDTRHFPYDANGNMTDIDGLQCTWDFKDRLVRAEDQSMRTEYRYDFAGRRIIKQVHWKQGEPTTLDGPGPTQTKPANTATLYPAKHFEVREHDQPVKYVFNGSTRVAKTTGSLSTRNRIQRLRLQAGWNLCSTAVGLANARTELSPTASTIPDIGTGVLSAAFHWDNSISNWLPSESGDDYPPGTILWLRAVMNATLALTGFYPDPTNRLITTGGSFQASPGLEPLSLGAGGLGVSTNVGLWHFDSSSQGWAYRLPVLQDVTSHLPGRLPPGSAFFVQANAPFQLMAPDPELRIRYYHQDHLGSSSAMTDAEGVLVEETAFFPFGVQRVDHRPRSLNEHYKFAQKECDRETGLAYFEARYLATQCARFATPDLKFAHPDLLEPQKRSAFLSEPKALNRYAYVDNNPLKYVDPTGFEKRALIIIGAGHDTLTGGASTRQRRTTDEDLKEVTQAYFARYNKGLTQPIVKHVSTGAEMLKLIESGSWESVSYFGHGFSNARALDPGTRVDMDELGDALEKSGAKRIQLLGCASGQTGLARQLSGRLSGATVLGIYGDLTVEWEREWNGSGSLTKNRLIPKSAFTEYKDGYEMKDGKRAEYRRHEMGDRVNIDHGAAIGREDPEPRGIRQ